jgi:phosphoribosylanthranilate isomerase
MVQVKICGITRVDEALLCARWGAHAVGCVFHPPSPRFVSDLRAAEIAASLPAGVSAVGVFCDVDYEAVMRRVERCGIRVVQLHGAESPDLVRRLQAQGVSVIKTLFLNRPPTFSDAEVYGCASAFLAECAGGSLPGGNAIAWDWNAARRTLGDRPLVIAGGLNPENVGRAVEEALPDAVDVSSGVESEPGRKDPEKVKRFLETVASCEPPRATRRIFP